MSDKAQIKKIKEAAEEFFEKMTIEISGMEVSFSVDKEIEVVDMAVKAIEPQILIGQQGQTLFEIQRLLRMVLSKKMQKIFYLNLDVNEYKQKKVEYLKSLAKELADQVALTKQEKVLLPMSSYERRVVHAELSQRADVTTESIGEGQDRHIIIKPK